MAVSAREIAAQAGSNRKVRTPRSYTRIDLTLGQCSNNVAFILKFNINVKQMLHHMDSPLIIKLLIIKLQTGRRTRSGCQA